jgi:hypothetical protein
MIPKHHPRAGHGIRVLPATEQKAHGRLIHPPFHSGWVPATSSADGAADLERVLGGALSVARGPGFSPLVSRHDRGRIRLLSSDDLALVGRMESDVAKALVLKALLARAERGLTAEVEPYAKMIGSLSDRELSRISTVLDLDAEANDSKLDPLELSERRGVVRDPDLSSGAADNDGLFQRFTASCGPTVVQMMLCEADPLAALAVHRGGIGSDRIDDATADFQRRLLEAGGGVAIGKREQLLRARIHNALGRLRAAGKIDRDEHGAFRRFIDQRGPRTARVDAILVEMRDRFGLPSDAEIARVRDLPKQDEGMTSTELLEAIETHVSPASGVRYTVIGGESGFARGQCWRYLDRVESALRKGIRIPFGISEPGHWMLMTDVRGRRPHRMFLVSDPEGGRTAWVSEKALRDGSFVDDQFYLCTGPQRGYIDTFLLPRPVLGA